MMWRILVVDDISMNSELLVEALGDLAECVVRENGTGALEAYNNSVKEDKPYDLILLDISMPDISGIDVLKTIRKSEESRGVRLGQGIPIVMVTAYKEPFMEAFNGGCDDYILKPVDTDKMIMKIREKLAGQTA